MSPLEIQPSMNSEPTSGDIRRIVDELYAAESRRVFATLIGLIGDFELAEEAMHDAFVAAVEQWPRVGVPQNPRSWLVSAGRFKAIDTIRRRGRFDVAVQDLGRDLQNQSEHEHDDHDVEDSRLRLIFTCCHPAINPPSQVALTLREVCGLTTEEVASAFLSTPPTIAQRIVRGKAKIRTAKIPYAIPSMSELPDRLDSVLNVIYLVFNEGYSASSGDALIRQELSEEAIRLGRLLVELLPDPEAMGLLALMLLHESRRKTRVDDAGDLILLEDQDRSRWDRALIDEGNQWLRRAIDTQQVGRFTVQALIAWEHARAASPELTNWSAIVRWYDLLVEAQPSPIVRLNRAVAVAMLNGPAVGLQLIDELVDGQQLDDYHLLYAARADLLRRSGRGAEASEAYRRALELAKQASERRFLQRRLDELTADS